MKVKLSPVGVLAHMRTYMHSVSCHVVLLYK